jgi:hypothetical protein
MGASFRQYAFGLTLSGCFLGCCHVHTTAGTPVPPGVQSHSRFHPVPTQPVFLARADLNPVRPCDTVSGIKNMEIIPPGPASPNVESPPPDPTSLKIDLIPPAPTPDSVYLPEPAIISLDASKHMAKASGSAMGSVLITDSGAEQADGTHLISKSSRSWIFTPALQPIEKPVVEARLPAELLEKGKANDRSVLR